WWNGGDADAACCVSTRDGPASGGHGFDGRYAYPGKGRLPLDLPENYAQRPAELALAASVG
ncbi:MAG: hypothetical protein NTZ05_18195, partial [Chloroflexi bacterium]|nr:hypothetical protein [Chloroflexota bacterium]